MPGWTPENWGDFSVVGIVVIVSAILYWSFITGRIVIGRYHREIVEGKDKVIDKQDARAITDTEIIRTLSQSLAEKNAQEDATTRILSAVREAVRGEAG